MLNRMCSEAELAVYMLQITSSSKRANSCLLFAPFGDGYGGFDLPQVPFPSVTTHAVKHSSPPSGTGLAPIRHTPELRMNRLSHTACLAHRAYLAYKPYEPDRPDKPDGSAYLITFFIILSMHLRFCAMSGCTYRLSVVPMLAWPSMELTVL